MWVPKWRRDQKKRVDSPVPTQVVSNEEFIPRPQTKKQKQVERLIGELSEERARALGMDRRAFLRSSMGLATAFLASNMVYGPYWQVSAEETKNPAATDEKYPKGEYFIIDVQTHFTNGFALGFRSAEFLRNMGFDLPDEIEYESVPPGVPLGSTRDPLRAVVLIFLISSAALSTGRSQEAERTFCDDGDPRNATGGGLRLRGRPGSSCSRGSSRIRSFSLARIHRDRAAWRRCSAFCAARRASASRPTLRYRVASSS